MSRRRSMKRSNQKSPRRVRPNLIEGLERRLLLTTVITDTDPLTPTPPTEQIEYKDARDNIVRVVVHGDVSAEFIWAIVQKGATIATLNPDFVPPPPPSGGTGTDVPGRDLFNIYVAQASIDSYISIAKVPAPNQGDSPRPMQPFDGAVDLRVFPIRGNEPVKTFNGGSVYLGARTIPADNSQNFGDNPIRQAGFHGIGIAPITHNQKLVAGIETAPGVSLGRFLFGGTISGNVRIDGSMESFYCGNLLTGVTEGQGPGTPLDPNNFHIGGDLHNLLVLGMVGNSGVSHDVDRDKPTYYSGTDIDIQGRVQMIKVGGDYDATAHIQNKLSDLGLRIRQQELEVHIDPTLNRGNFTEFQNGQFGDNQAFFNDDNFDNPQFIGSINGKQLGPDSVQLNGILQWQDRINDAADFYALPLMAGQTVQVRLLSPIVSQFTFIKNGRIVHQTIEDKSALHVGVFDPDARLIASDFSNQTVNTNRLSQVDGDVDAARQELFSFTADRPGIYRFAVGLDAPNFSGGSPFIGEQPYQLQITGVGNLGLGGMFVQGTVLSEAVAASDRSNSITGDLANIEVVHGDLGALYSLDYFMSNVGINALADGGDLRAFDAASFGFNNNGTHSSSAELEAITGSVGMVRSRDDSATDATASTGFNRTVGFPIGGDLQWFISRNWIRANIIVNGSIGTIQANHYGVRNFAGEIAVNADNIGRPGVIDLIDVTADLGTLEAGGPAITTGPGGNVRYIHISPSSTAYRSREFGGSQPEETTYVQGQEARITDDSGAQIQIIPTQETVVDSNGLPILDNNLMQQNNSGTLTVLTYPIAASFAGAGGFGGGITGTGSVIIRITSTRGAQVRASGGTAEIGEILSTGTGPGLVSDVGPDGVPNTGDEDLGPDGRPNTGDESFELDPTFTPTGNPPDNGIDLRSSGRHSLIDVYMVRGNNFDVIRNRTEGEIVNTRIGTVGRLEANNLGWARSSVVPGMATQQSTVADMPGTADIEGNTFPFNDTTNAIVIGAVNETLPTANEILARQALGNVMALGRVQQISANADGAGTKQMFEGIVGSVFVKGETRGVMIGEGLAPSGTGNFSKAGLFDICDFDHQGTPGMGRIEKVVNQGLGSDIRGDIITNTGIGKIGLTNGSIINAEIGVTETGATGTTRTGLDVSSGLEFGSTADHIVQGTANNVTLGNIDQIVTEGIGGIIGLSTFSNNIGPVSATGGFGVFNSTFDVLGNGRFGATVADGYGYRGASWVGGQSIDSINATGSGKRLPTTAFEPSVRYSESLGIDPFFGTKPNPLTDLHVVLGTTAANPIRKGASASGSIDVTDLRLSRDAGSIKANTIRSSFFTIGNNYGSIQTRSYVESTTITGGRLDSILIGGDATRTDIGITGPVGDAHIGGSFKGSSTFHASGENGTIGSFVTDQTLYGNVYAQAGIGSIRVGTYYGSEGTYTPRNIGLFVVGKDFLSNARLQVGKRTSDAAGRLTRLIIEGDFQDGGLIDLNSLGTKTILGADQGTIDTKPWA